MAKKVAVLFVCYYPTKEDIEYINNFKNNFYKCYIYNNTPNSDINGLLYDNVWYYADGVNHGLAVAYNQVIKKAQNDGVEWLAIFDQDSRIDNIEPMLGYLEMANDNDAIVCPFIKYNNEKLHSNEKTNQIEWTINSGSILNLDIIKKYHIKYDEYYFLDRLDRDFCKQIREKKLNIIQVNETILCQILGDGDKAHSPIRNYYMATIYTRTY